MRALVLGGSLHLETRYPDPQPAPGLALVKVRYAGICRTDLELLRGYMGFRGVLGHEFVGTVVRCDDEAWDGRRVVGEINCPCGSCSFCLAGLGNHCPDRTVLGIAGRDGAFAEMLALPRANLHAVPEGVADEAAVFAEPLAAALEVLEQVHMAPNARVVVLGDGKLGQLVARVLRLVGCDLLVVGHHEAKLRLLGALGIATSGGGGPERCADVVVECTGREEGFAQALKLVRPRGTVVVKSTFHGLASLLLSRVVVDEVRVVGSRCGPFAPALRLLERSLVPTQDLVSAVYPLEAFEQALATAARPEALKVLLRVSGT